MIRRNIGEYFTFKRLAAVGAVLCVISLFVWLGTNNPTQEPASAGLAETLDSNLQPRTLQTQHVSSSGQASSGMTDTEEEASPVIDGRSTPASSPLLRPSDRTIGDSTAQLMVVVLDQQTDLPLSEVSVDLAVNNSQNGSTPQPLTQLSDAEGIALFDVPAGQPILLVANWRQTYQKEMTIPALAEGEIMEWVVKLQTTYGFTFYGRVVSKENGEPVAGARVWTTNGEDNGVVIDETRSDQNGMFGFAVPNDIASLAYATAPGYSHTAFRVSSRLSSLEDPLTIQLRQSGRLRVIVKDQAGAPVSGLDVLVRTRGFHIQADAGSGDITFRVPNPSWSSTTDYNGETVLDDLVTDVPLRVELLQGGDVLQSSGEPIFVAANEEKLWEVVLGGGGEIVGRLLDHEGQPIANYTVWLVRDSQFLGRVFNLTGLTEVEMTTTTSERGEFRFKNVQAGTWRVGPAVLRGNSDILPGDRVTPVNQSIKLNNSQTVETTIYTQQGLYISGKVIDSNNNPVANSLVSARKEGEGFYYQSTQTTDQGAFVLGPVEPGTMILGANPVLPHQGPTPKVEVNAGAENVLLQLGVGGRVSGQIIDGDSGNPLNAHVRLRGTNALDGEQMFYPSLQRNSDRFSFEGVAPGRYTLNATSEKGAEGKLSFELAPGEQLDGLVVRLIATGKLFITYNGRLEEVVATAKHMDSDQEHGYVSFSKEQGRDGTMLLGAGDYHILLRDAEWNILHQTELRIAAGEEKRIVLDDEGGYQK